MAVKKTIRMKKEPFKNWMKHLRSGKYNQAKEVLTDHNGGYCCLGVACVSAGWNDADIDGWLSGGFDEVMPGNLAHSVYGTQIYQPYRKQWQSVDWEGDEGQLDLIVTLSPKTCYLVRKYVTEEADRLDRPAQNFDVGQEVGVSLLNDKGVPFEVIATILEENVETY